MLKLGLAQQRKEEGGPLSVATGSDGAELTNLTASDTSVQSNSQSPAPIQPLAIRALTETRSTRVPHESRTAIGVEAVDGTYGVIVLEVSPGPAQQGGLKIGDTVIAVDENRIKTTQMLDAALASHVAGSRVKINYIRNGIAAETGVDLPSSAARNQ